MNTNDVQLHQDKPVSGYPPSELVTLARYKMLERFPFFGRLALRLRIYETNVVPTAAVDFNGRFYYNPKFFNACDLNDAMWVMSHEVMHLVQRCHQRMPEYGSKEFWNAAADIVVNQTLADVKFEEKPFVPNAKFQSVFLGFPQEHKKYRGWYTERVYYDLLKQAAKDHSCEACKQIAQRMVDAHEKKKQQGKNGDSGDESSQEGDPLGGEKLPEHTCKNPQGCCSGSATDSSSKGADPEQQDRWTRHVLGAAEGLEKGSVPAAVADMIEELRRPVVRWRELVRSTAQSVFGKGRYSWKRPGRRSLATGVRLPSQKPDKLGALVWLDTSGSINREMLIQFNSEVAGILQQTGCKRILVGLHDVFVYALHEISSPQDILNMKFARGGTSHQDVFEISNGGKGRNGIELLSDYKVGMVICMSDMMSDFPSIPPTYPVIWGIPSQYFHENHWMDPGFGRAVEIEI